MKRFDDKKFLGMLGTETFGRTFFHLPVTVSTNDHAADMLDNAGGQGLDNLDGSVILSDEQTGGKGRFNRRWLSPPGGLWFSLIFKTELPEDKIPAVTLIAAFSAASILMDSYGIDVSIKWPNDLYSRDLKFGGILSETKQSGSIKFIIMGMGFGLFFPNNNSLVMSQAPEGKKGVFSGLFNTFNNMGGAIGVCLFEVVYAWQTSHHEQLSISETANNSWMIAGFRDAYLLAVILGISASLISVSLKKT